MGDIATGMLDVFTGDAVKELLDLRPWMQDKKFILLTKPAEVEEYIDRLIEKGICGLDLETTSLNTRKKKDGGVYAKIVGVCLAISPNEGVYIPVLHEDKEYNVPYKFMIQQLKRLTSNCVCVYHNFKYDGEVLRNHGIIIEDEDMYEDTYLMGAIQDASRKDKGLKWLSEHILKRPMIEISELGVTGAKKGIVAFSMVPPQTAVYYGASDAMNTLGLYLVFKKSLDKQDPDGKQGPWYIYKIEKRCLFVTMEMERNKVLIDKEYLLQQKEEVQNRMKKILKDVHDIAGREFDINSPKQLGIVLFDELKIRYPLKEKSANGQYKTDEKTLILIEQEAPIVKKILLYRGYTKLLGTYIENFLNNVDEDNYAKFQLNQVRADTGRFSASGGKGIKQDGYCGVNCQNIPTYNKSDPDSIDMRRAVIARPGYKIATIDYSGEELRIAANMSREPKWIHEFNHGSADLHTITGKIIHGKEEITKQERGLGKCVAKGTRVATQRGWVPIEKLTLKDKVITHKGKMRGIEQIHDMGTKRAITIISSSGHKIKCGYNHRFLTPSGDWVRAEDLIEGQEILTSSCELINPKSSPKIHFNFWAKGKDNNLSDALPYIEPNKHWGKLLGYLMGDGHIHKYHAGVICSDKYSDVKDDIMNTARSLGLPCSAKLKKRKDKPDHYQPLWNINIGSTIFSRFCERIGFTGRHKKIFRVPRWIFESNKEVVKGFIQSLFETDGTVDKSGTVSLCTKDQELARDVILLLALFDIKAYIYEKPSKRYKRVYYQVQFGRAGAENFYKYVGFISNIKNLKLKELVSKPKSSSTLKGQKWVTTVKAKEFHDSEELMDLTVKKDHTYVAEGLVTHNTLNFHTIYGGGAGGFAVRAKLSVDVAKKMLFNFFKKYDVLAKWLNDEAKRAKKRGHSKTAFGRRRPLAEFYRSNDRQIMARGDRCAINSAIQGCLQPQERCLTNKGYLPIKEIETRKNSGESLLIWTGTSWEEFDVLNRGKCQFAKITLENGLRLYCDTRHEVLVVGKDNYKFKKYKDLTKDDQICVSVPRALEYGTLNIEKHFSGGRACNSKDIYLKDTCDLEFVSYLIGLCVGDGNVRFNSRHSMTLSMGKEDFSRYLDKVKQGVERLNLKLGKVRKSEHSLGDSYQVSINSKALVSLFSYFGYEKGWDAKTKRVPKKIYETPLFMRNAFLKGYFDSDGCKKAINRYNFHTANKELLEDVQALAWTSGLASVVKTQSDGTHILLWSDLRQVEKVLRLPVLKSSKRTGGSMLLPSYMYDPIYSLLKDVGMESNNDRALLCNLNKRRKILVPTVIKLLEKYNIEFPTMYYHYKLKEKVDLDKVEDTYTLSVYSDLHRFDSSCIISKNTGADVIKIALYKVWKWLRSNGFGEDDVRILMPVHDEIVYEIKEEKLGYFIENISEIMKLRDFTERLKWPVGFEVDAEYGDSFSITNDYFKEKAALEKEARANGEALPDIKNEFNPESQPSEEKPEVESDPEPAPQEEKEETPDEKREEPKIEKVEKEEVQTEQEPPSSPPYEIQQHNVVTGNNGTDPYISFSVTLSDIKSDKVEQPKEEEEVDEKALADDRLKDCLDDMGFFVHEIKSIVPMSSSHLKTIIEMLKEYDSQLVGPKCRIKLVAPDGTVLLKVYNKVSVDAFQSLCLWYNI